MTSRQKFNLLPVPGGDTPYLQQQNFSLAALAKRDAKDDPFATGAAPSPAPAPASDPDAADKRLDAALFIVKDAAAAAQREASASAEAAIDRARAETAAAMAQMVALLDLSTSACSRWPKRPGLRANRTRPRAPLKLKPPRAARPRRGHAPAPKSKPRASSRCSLMAEFDDAS